MQEKTAVLISIYFMMLFCKTIQYRKKSRGFGTKQKTSFTTYVTWYLTLDNCLNLPELPIPVL